MSIPNILSTYASKKSNKNVIFMEFPQSAYDPASNSKIMLFCNVCGKCLIVTDDYNRWCSYTNPSNWMDSLEDFCVNHRHEMETGEFKTMDFVGDLKINVGGRRANTVAISQETFKQVNRLSNFNVNLQAKTSNGVCTEYRAICDKCNQTIHFDYEKLAVNQNDSETWVTLSVFCNNHRHEKKVDIMEGFGRKFRKD